MKNLFKILFLFICFQIKLASASEFFVPSGLINALTTLVLEGPIESFNIVYEDNRLEFSRNLDSSEPMHFQVFENPNIIKITRKIRIPDGRFSGALISCYSDWNIDDPYIQETFEFIDEHQCRYRQQR
ncbi:MAG: hypothetical protein V1646_05425 [bacterium]